MKLSRKACLPTSHGLFDIQAVRHDDGSEHLILLKGDVVGEEDVPLRIHSACTTGEVLHSLRCDCNQQLIDSLDFLELEGKGVVIYLRQEGRGIGLFNKIESYALQDRGLDTVEANIELGFPSDSRTYELAAAIIIHFEIRSVRILTNNPKKIRALESHGIRITGRIPLKVCHNKFNREYLTTKKNKLAHLL